MKLRVYVSLDITNDNYYEHDMCIQTTLIVICLVIVYIVCMLYILPNSES